MRWSVEIYTKTFFILLTLNLCVIAISAACVNEPNSTSNLEHRTINPAASTSSDYETLWPSPSSQSTYINALPTATAPPSASYIIIVNRWRSKLGMKAFARDPKLESNAIDVVYSSHGEMVHKFNHDTFGQVLAPGNDKDFEHVFVGGWLCEIPSLPGLDDVCDVQSKGWEYNGQTSHAELLTSNTYSRIGCAYYAGIWCCDLA